MFNVFDIPQPVIGMGHSMGGAQVYLKIFVPLFISDFTLQLANQAYIPH